MENLLFGIGVVLICTILFYYAFRHYQSQQYQKAVSLVLLAGLLLRIFTSFDLYLHEWDERYHALVAKNLIENPWKPMLYKHPILDFDYRNWTSNHIWLHKQPIPLYAMALSMYLFGANVLALRLPSIILSTLTIFITYKIGELLFNKKIGLFAAFLCSINGLIIELTAGRVATDHIDIFFLAFIAISVYFALRFSKERKVYLNVLCGIFIGAAILSKWLPALIVLPIWLLAVYKENKGQHLFIFTQSIKLLLVIALVVTPWQIYIHSHFPMEASWEANYNRKHIFEVLGAHANPFYYHFDKMRIIFGELVYVPLLWLLWQTFRRKTNFNLWILLLWIIVPYLFFSIAKTKMQAYTLFTAPAIFIMVAIFIRFANVYKSKFAYPILIRLLSIGLLILPIRYAFERIKPFEYRPRTKIWITEMKRLESTKSVGQQVIFNCKYPIATMFFTDMIAYDVVPEKSKLQELNDQGYSLFIDNAFEVAEEKQNLKLINYVQITGQ